MDRHCVGWRLLASGGDCARPQANHPQSRLAGPQCLISRLLICYPIPSIPRVKAANTVRSTPIRKALVTGECHFAGYIRFIVRRNDYGEIDYFSSSKALHYYFLGED